MIKCKFFILTAFLIVLSSAAYSADTVIIRDTVYVFDSTKAVATSLAELKAELYDKALQGVERDKSFITLILTIIGIILIIIAGSAIYSVHLNKQAREEITREISRFQEKYEDIKLKAEEVDVIVEDLKQKSMHMDKEKEDAKTRLQMRPDEIDKLINSDDAKELIPIYEKELTKLEKANEIDTIPPLVHKNAGLSYVRLKEYSKALFALKRFLNSIPGDTEALFYTGKSLDGLELYEQATVEFALSIKSDPDNLLKFNGDSYNLWGVSLGELYDISNDQSLLNQAVKKFKYAIAAYDKHEPAYYNWASALKRFYDARKEETFLKQAIKVLRQAIAVNAKSARVYANLGDTLFRLYEIRKDDVSLLEQAIEQFKQATDIDDKNYETYHNWGLILGHLYYAHRDDSLIKDAIEKYQKAIDLNPEHASSHYGIACAHSLQGQKEQMLNALEKAISLDSKYAAIALEDDDFAAYKNDAKFLALVKPAKDDKKSQGKSKNRIS